MRTQSHLSLLDVPEDLPDCDGGCFRPGGGLCCPDDPLDLVLQFFPNPDPAPHEISLAALGIGSGGSPRRQDQSPSLGWAQENACGGIPVLDAGSAPGGGGGVWERDSCGLASCAPVLLEDMELIDDVDKYLVKNEPDDGSGAGAGGEVTVCNPSRNTETMPGGGAPACGASGGVVSNGAPPSLAPMFSGALHPYARLAFPGVDSNGAPPLPAAALKPEPGGLQACGAARGVASNGAPAPPMPAGALQACGAPVGAVSNGAPPSRAHALPPARTLQVSGTSSGCPTPTTSDSSSQAPVWQPLAWAVRRKRRRPTVKGPKRPWSLDFPLHTVPVAPPSNPGFNNGNDDDAKNSCDNAGGGGGIRRRRPVPRQRNRQTQRVCSHCHSPDTPQWRAGPDGPGTLCNACGIRYAANKLPEYRPSTAPSFRSDLHSNRHRKVVKLREQKAEETLKVKPDPVPVSPKSDEFMGVCTYISTG